MIKVLRQYIENDTQVTEYSVDGKNVSHRVEVPVQSEAPTEVNLPIYPQETTEQKIERLEQQVQQDNLILFDVLATIYDEVQSLKGSV